MRKIKLFFVLTCLLAVIATSGCGSSSKPATNIPVAPTTQEIPAVPMATKLPDYRLQTGDVVQIKMLLNPELNEEVTVRPDGKISTTLVQDMQAYGKTAQELQRNLVTAYKEHLIDPKLTVVVDSYSPSRVYVLGEVASPGEIVSAGPSMTLLQAIARSGGLLASGDEEQIMIFRRNDSGDQDVYRADYEAATSGMGSDIRLAAYDVVFVPRTGVADTYKSYQQNIQQFLPLSLGLGVPGL